MKKSILGFVIIFVLAACSSLLEKNAETVTSDVSAESVIVKPTDETLQIEVSDGETSPERNLLAGTNIALHSVPLSDVHFDTFNGSYLPLSEADEASILRLRDAIPPVWKPKYTDVAAADRWLNETDMVVGYVDGDEALAYPTKILNYHEIVNENVNGIPVLISYCPLCNSGIVYDRRVGDQVLEFGNTSALYQSDMVMYDKQTLSYWFQVEGAAIVGDLTGEQMEVLPTRFMQWSEWKATYPDSQVLSRDTGFDRPYDRDPFNGLETYLNRGNFAFPVGDDARNPSLPAGERIISVVINEEARAYSLIAHAGKVINDEVDGVPIAVVIGEKQSAFVFGRQVDNQVLTFKWENGLLQDEETGSQWDLNGTGVAGTLAGEQLEAVPARFSYWFAFVAAFPNATVYEPQG